MAEGFAQYRGFWQKLTLVQRVALVGVALAVVVIGLYLANCIRQPTMVLLKGNLPADEAAAIDEKLREAGVAYKIQGTRIYVDQARKDEMVLLLARENLIGGDRGGYELLDKERIGEPPSSTSMRQRRAQEGELEKILRMIDGVVTARVIITPGETSVFANRGRESSAGVMVTLDTGTVASAAMIRTIVNTVSGATNIPPHRIAVSDSRGQPLAGQSTPAEGSALGGGNSYHDYKTRVDDADAKKIQDMLDSVLGPGRSSVKVSNVIATTAVIETTSTPTDIKMPETEEVVTIKRQQVPDAAGNIENENNETVRTTYKVGSTVVTRQEMPGVVKSKSVAVFVDLQSPMATALSKSGEPAGPIMTVEDVERIVRAAVGIDEKKDTIEVVSVPFVRLFDAAETDGAAEMVFGPAYIMDLVKQGSVAVLSLAAVATLWLLSRGKRERRAKPASAPGALVPSPNGLSPAALTGGAAAALSSDAIGLLPGLTEVDLNAERLRAHISKALQDNPEEVKRLFLSWVDSDKELV